MSHSILLINGPNLNLLGTREPEIYGAETLADIEKMSKSQASDLGANLECFQSNHEGEIIEAIHIAKETHNAIIINPGAFTHTSIAIRDALSGVELPVYEVHISNVHTREDFRHNSYVSGIAVGVICGFGTKGYHYAIETAVSNLIS